MSEQFSPFEALQRMLDDRLLDVHTMLPCKITEYDAATQTVSVEPQVKRTLRDADGAPVHEALPILHDVPVAFPRGGGYHLTFPIAVGNACMVVFSESPTVVWRDTAKVSNPGLLERHSLNGAFALVGGYPDKERLGTAPSTTDVVLAADDGSSAVVVKSGEVLLGDATASQLVALEDLVSAELNALKTTINNFINFYNAHTHTGNLGNPTTTIIAPAGGPAIAHGTVGSVAATKTKAK